MTIDIFLQKLKSGPLYKLIKVLATLLLILLVVFLALRAVKLSYLYLPTFKNTAVIADNTGNRTSGTGDYLLPSGISDLKLFGEYKEQVTPQSPQPRQEAPKVKKVKLVLHGLLALSNPKYSSAVISQPGAETKVYGIGEKLPGNAKLLEIHSDHIVVSYSGDEQELWFNKDKQNQEAAVASKSVAQSKKHKASSKFNSNSLNQLVEEYGVGGTGGISALTKKFTGNPSRDDIKTYYNELNKVPANELFNTVATEFESDPSGFVKQLGLKPQRSRGYLVTSKIPKQFVDAYNLEYGDRILEINGQQLGDPRRDKQIFNNIRQAGQATVKIQRGRQITTVSVPVTY